MIYGFYIQIIKDECWTWSNLWHTGEENVVFGKRPRAERWERREEKRRDKRFKYLEKLWNWNCCCSYIDAEICIQFLVINFPCQREWEGQDWSIQKNLLCFLSLDVVACFFAHKIVKKILVISMDVYMLNLPYTLSIASLFYFFGPPLWLWMSIHIPMSKHFQFLMFCCRSQTMKKLLNCWKHPLNHASSCLCRWSCFMKNWLLLCKIRYSIPRLQNGELKIKTLICSS